MVGPLMCWERKGNKMFKQKLLSKLWLDEPHVTGPQKGQFQEFKKVSGIM